MRLLHRALDLQQLYNLRLADLQGQLGLNEDEIENLSPLGFCQALAERKGYKTQRGRGAPDPHRAGLEVLKDTVDGALCLSFAPPSLPPSTTVVELG